MIWLLIPLGLYLAVQVWQLLMVLLYRAGDRNIPETWPQISIWVAARNEENNIIRCLESLHALDYPQDKIRILIGNDQSTDRTQQMVEDYIRDKPCFQLVNVVDNDFPTRGKARVMAQLEPFSAGEYVLVTDADVVVKPQWAKSMVASFDAPTGVISGTTMVTGETLSAKLEGVDWTYFMGLLNLISYSGVPATAVGNNMAVRKTAYDETGGYSAIRFSITEDYKLYREVCLRGWKWKNIMQPDVLAYSRPVGSFSKLLHQRKRWLKGGMELPWYWWLLFGVFALYYFLLPLMFFFVSPATALGVAAGKLFLQSSTLMVIYRHLGEKPPSPLLLFLYELYLFVTTILTAFFFLLPVKTDWKGRKY